MCLSKNPESSYLGPQSSWSLHYSTQLPRQNALKDISLLIRFNCTSVFLRWKFCESITKAFFDMWTLTVFQFSLEKSHFPAVLEPCVHSSWLNAASTLLPCISVVFSCCVEDWAKMPHHAFTLLLWVSLSLQAISYLTDPSVGFHDTLLCFLSLSSLFDCLVLAS